MGKSRSGACAVRGARYSARVRSRTTRLVVLGLAVAAVGAGAGFAIHKATDGSAAPLRDCAAPLAAAQRALTKADAKLKALRAQDAKQLTAFKKLPAELTAIEK